MHSQSQDNKVVKWTLCFNQSLMASVMSNLQLYSLNSRKFFEKIKVSFSELSYKVNNHQAVDERYIWSKSFNWKLTCYFRFYWRHQSRNKSVFLSFFFVGLQRQSAACFLIRRQRSSRTIAASIKLTSRWSALLPEPEGAAHSAGQSGQWTAQRVLWHAHTHKKKKSFRLFRRRIKRASAEMIRWQSFLNNSFIYKLRECQQWNFLRKYSTINNWLK